MNSRSESIDVLRGAAVIGVVAVHSVLLFNTESSSIDKLIGLGRFGVQLFFFLSAYTITMVWIKRLGEQRQALLFYAKRFFRLFPFYILFIPVNIYIFTNPVHGVVRDFNSWDVALNVILMNSFSPTAMNSVVSGGWSISVEWVFYLIFPIIFKYAHKNYKMLPLVAIIIILLNISVFRPLINEYFENKYNFQIVNDFVALNFLSQAPVFVFGIAFFYAIYFAQFQRFVVILSITLVVLISFSKFYPVRDVIHYIAYISIVIIAACCLHLNIKNYWLEVFGSVSYEIYLIHTLVLYIIELLIQRCHFKLGFIPVFVLVLVISLFFSLGLKRLKIDVVLFDLFAPLLKKMENQSEFSK